MKIDIFKRMMWFTYRDDPSNFIAVSVDKVKEILALNKDGKKAGTLRDETIVIAKPAFDFENVVGQDDLSRFDNKGGGGNSGRNKKRKKGGNSSSRPGGKPQANANAKSGGTPNSGNRNRNRNNNSKPNPKKEG